jgi:hypothetical protein
VNPLLPRFSSEPVETVRTRDAFETASLVSCPRSVRLTVSLALGHDDEKYDAMDRSIDRSPVPAAMMGRGLIRSQHPRRSPLNAVSDSSSWLASPRLMAPWNSLWGIRVFVGILF